MSLLVAGLLFFILSPGVLLTIPPCSKGLFASGQTSIAAAAVHAVVFVAVSYLLASTVEGFKGGLKDPLKCDGPDGSSCDYGIPGMDTGTCCKGRCMDYYPSGTCQ